MAYIYDCTKLGLSHSTVPVIGIDPEKEQHCHGQPVNNENDRGHNPHEQMDDRRIQKSHLLCVDGSHSLWRNLSEQEDHKS